MTVILPNGWTGLNTGCCTDATERGQQLVVEELAFDQVSSTIPSITRRTSWGYVTPEGEIITLIGNANCAGGNMAYFEFTPAPAADCCQLNHFVDVNVADHPALVLPNASYEAVNTVVGSSDEPIYVFMSANAGVLTSAFYPDSNTHVVYNDPGGGVAHLLPSTFAKKGNRFYGFGTSGAFTRHIVVYDAQAGGAELEDWDALAVANLQAGCANVTDTLLICLCSHTITGAASIQKLSLVDGSIMESIDLTDIGARRSFAVNENLIYLASNVAMYYLSGTDLVYVGRLVAPTFSVFGGNAIFSGGVMYYGQSGAGDANVQIYKVEMPCPEGGALIASISTDDTIAAGADIDVTWDGILDPTNNDVIALRPAPVGGALGFTGSSLANLATGGPLAAGTLPFTIPALTTPGDYIFQLTRGGSILIATSNVFAVT